MSADVDAVNRLQRAVHAGRREQKALRAAQETGGDLRWSQGVFIASSTEILDAVESAFGPQGEPVTYRKAMLPPASLDYALTQLRGAAQHSRALLEKAQQCTHNAAAFAKADAEYIESVGDVMDMADHAFRLAQVKAAPEPAPAPPPVQPASPAESDTLADALFTSMQRFVTQAISQQSGKDREDVQRMFSDKLGELRDSLRTREDLRELKDMQAKSEFDRRIASLGKTFNAMLNRRLDEAQNKAAKEAARHASAKANEVRKELLARVEIHSDTPEVIGWTPSHEWRGTEIRFEQEPGVWGPWVDVQGDRGRDGIGGGGAINTKRLEMDGGGAFDENTTLDGKTAGADIASLPGIGGGGADTVFDSRSFNGGRSI